MKEHTVLVVDDNEESIAVLGGLLRPLYRVRVANSGKRALAVTRLSGGTPYARQMKTGTHNDD